MKTQNRSTKLLVLTTFLSILFMIGVRAEQVQAFDTTDAKPSPMVGLAEGQTARLNVVNIGDPNQGSCQVQLIFYDNAGKQLALDSQKIDPGIATFLDLSYNDIGNPNIRVQIRSWVRVLIGDPSICLSSLEVFDDETGKTTLFVGDPHIK
jgi:hypothetical protein